MSIRILTAIAVTTLAVAAPTATAAHTALKDCGVVNVKGWSFHVGEVGLKGCAPAKALVKQLATAKLPKPNSVVHYPGTYLTMKCFGSAGKLQGATAVQIQCASADYRKSIVSLAKR